MMRWWSITDRGAMALVAVLCVAAATPLVAQQDSVPTPQSGASAAPASAATTSLAGPRLRPEWQRVEPSFRGSSGAASMAASGGGSHTITVTTLVLVLLIVIVVLLI
jgi:hypothetical protein